MPSCEKCWKDAKGDAELYHLLAAARDASGDQCTPEEHAGGEDAGVCPICSRKAVHAICKVCIACGWEEGEETLTIRSESS